MRGGKYPRPAFLCSHCMSEYVVLQLKWLCGLYKRICIVSVSVSRLHSLMPAPACAVHIALFNGITAILELKIW